jgi:hypothetical protein
VLRALASGDDEHLRHGFLHLGRETGNPLGLDLDNFEIHESIMALCDADYLDAQVNYESGPQPGALFTHLTVTGRGQQALGEWPLFDAIASPETLALLLERFADRAATDEEESNLRSAAAYVRGLGLPALRALATGAAVHGARALFGLG